MDIDYMITLLDVITSTEKEESASKAIENQEKRGQKLVVKNQILPKKQKNNDIENTKQQYERMGIVIIEEYDDLFWSVALPEGWKVEETDHSMWNNLFDNKGRKRASFFYKAAFYDRDAFINFYD